MQWVIGVAEVGGNGVPGAKLPGVLVAGSQSGATPACLAYLAGSIYEGSPIVVEHGSPRSF